MVPQVKAKWIDAGVINGKGPKELCPVFPSSTVPGYQDLPRVADNPTLLEEPLWWALSCCYPFLGAQSPSPESQQVPRPQRYSPACLP